MSKPLTDEEISRYDEAWTNGDLCDDICILDRFIAQARLANRLRELMRKILTVVINHSHPKFCKELIREAEEALGGE